MTYKTFLKTTVTISACVMLAACQTTGTTPHASGGGSIDAAIDRAANASNGREAQQPLSVLEKNYKRNSSDPVAATQYAAGLRNAEYLNQAALIIAPFANDKKSPAMTKTEYAAIQLALGNNKSAEQYAQKAVLQDTTDYKAYHYLGIALDAQGMHPEAERAFRKALDTWQGDPTPVMNNLALNLTAQDQVDEAATILEKAQSMAPDRVEIERNLRIVRTLQQSAHHAPKPQRKPGFNSGSASAPAASVPAVKKAPVAAKAAIPTKMPASKAAAAPVTPVSKTPVVND